MPSSKHVKKISVHMLPTCAPPRMLAPHLNTTACHLRQYQAVQVPVYRLGQEAGPSLGPLAFPSFCFMLPYQSKTVRGETYNRVQQPCTITGRS